MQTSNAATPVYRRVRRVAPSCAAGRVVWKAAALQAGGGGTCSQKAAPCSEPAPFRRRGGASDPRGWRLGAVVAGMLADLLAAVFLWLHLFRILFKLVKVGSAMPGSPNVAEIEAKHCHRRLRPPRQKVAMMMQASRNATGIAKKSEMYQKAR